MQIFVVFLFRHFTKKHECQPHGGARGNVGASPKWFSSILWGPWTQNFMSIHQIVGPKVVDQLSDTAMPRVKPPAWLKRIWNVKFLMLLINLFFAGYQEQKSRRRRQMRIWLFNQRLSRLSSEREGRRQMAAKLQKSLPVGQCRILQSHQHNCHVLDFLLREMKAEDREEQKKGKGD